ncbi:MAG: hypothetical protein WBQ78_13035 [Gammaproteobacteria bacterium]
MFGIHGLAVPVENPVLLDFVLINKSNGELMHVRILVKEPLINSLISSRRMPGSGVFISLDAGFRRHDGPGINGVRARFSLILGTPDEFTHRHPGACRDPVFLNGLDAGFRRHDELIRGSLTLKPSLSKYLKWILSSVLLSMDRLGRFFMAQ